METAQLERIVRDCFGFAGFRPDQAEIVQTILGGRDVLAVLPTGAGKSLVYQVAALTLPGVTIVVSPLIALMKDQVDGLRERRLPVAVVHGQQSAEATAEAIDQAAAGAVKLLYLTPERLQNAEFQARLRDLSVALFVVDEAHCVSEWGPSFRPAYLGLGPAARQIGRPPILALTATATPWVRRDIIDQLDLKHPRLIVRGADRPNLFLEVRRVEDEAEDQPVIERLLTDPAADYPADWAARLEPIRAGSGIIYTGTTRAARETAEWLRRLDIPADYYHGQRSRADRERVQEAFMAGKLRVIAATNAFGLGVDKPDIRFVIHRDVPASLEAYAQEAGRAGRDGDLARCTLIYRPGDLGRAAFLGTIRELTVADVSRVRAALLQTGGATAGELAEVAGLSPTVVARVLTRLRDQGLIVLRRNRYRPGGADFNPAEVSLEAEARRRAFEHGRLEMMRGYAELHDCRRHYLLNYFGEETAGPACGLCDNDVRGISTTGEPPERNGRPFEIHDRVAHPAWGEGTVQRVTPDTVTVVFDRAGHRTLATDLVVTQGLLTASNGRALAR